MTTNRKIILNYELDLRCYNKLKIILRGIIMIERKSLFYPCCGNDIIIPLIEYNEIIDDFWFVDIENNERSNLDTIMSLLQSELSDNVFIGKIFSGKMYGLRIKDNEKYVLSINTYKIVNNITKRVINIHLCKGNAYSAFRSIFDDLKYNLYVFFHRRDSQGEGGSNQYFLSKRHIKDILNKFNGNKGFIVTDGTLALSKFSDKNVNEIRCRGYVLKYTKNIEGKLISYKETREWKIV